MQINVYMNKSGAENTWVAVFHKIYDGLEKKYPEVTFKVIYSEYMRGGTWNDGTKYSWDFMILEHNWTKRYIVISYWDYIEELSLDGSMFFWKVHDCSEIITGLGTFTDARRKRYRYPIIEPTPFSYVCQRTDAERLIEVLYKEKNEKKVPDKPSFRGRLYRFRTYLSKNPNYDIICSAKHPLSLFDYLSELNDDLINFSIDGQAEICHRDIEVMGLGNALIRTKLKTKLHNPLIPNHHYISVDVDDIDFDLSEKLYWRAVSDRILKRYNEVKDDIEFLKFIGANGRKWYKENGTVKQNARIAVELIDLDNFDKRDYFSEQKKLFDESINKAKMDSSIIAREKKTIKERRVDLDVELDRLLGERQGARKEQELLMVERIKLNKER